MRSALLWFLVLVGPAYAGDICAVARAKENFSGLEVPAAFRAEAAKYRKRWADYCERPEPSRVTALYEAFLAFGPALDKWVAPEETQTVLDKMRAQLPTFLPGVSCYLYDGGTFCSMAHALLEPVALAGKAEDKLFAETFRDVRGYETTPPWIQQTWDYGGCARFGEYDWVANLRKIDDALDKTKATIYREQLQRLRGSLLSEISGDVTRQGICSCKAKGAPLEDLPKIIAYLEKRGDSKKPLSLARTLLQGLRSKKFSLRSEAEAHCSGG